MTPEQIEKLQRQNEQLIAALSAMYYHFGSDTIEDDGIYHPDCVRAVKQAKHALRDAGVDTRRLSG